MKSLPIGIQDFKTIMEGDYYYVDKSMLIGQMLNQNKNGVFLYTRPRRFGKSLNLSMIDAFFNLRYEGNAWFDGLEISNHAEFNEYKNAFPVIFIDLRCGTVNNFDDFLNSMRATISNIYDRFEYLLHSRSISDINKDRFTMIYAGKGNASDISQSVKELCNLLEKHHHKKTIVLLDEYDNCVNSISDPDLRMEIVSFLRTMLSFTLKGNDSLELGVVTGVMQITKENIFSGLNNLYVNNILKKEFDEMFGFTDIEVKAVCNEYGHPEKFYEAKEWYDGYRFGEADIYNPWSILNYIQEGFKPDTYWANTSSNSIINDMLSVADSTTMDNLRKLGSGETVTHDVSASITFDDLNCNPDAIYSLMAVSGYLKSIPEGNKYALSIPNRELYSVFAQIIYRSAVKGSCVIANLKDFSDAILGGNTKVMEQSLYEIISDTLSSRVLDNEHSYQAFIAGLLMNLSGRYEIKADFEAGKGYYDIRMRNKTGIGSNAIIEIKRSESMTSRERDAQSALKQIVEKDYTRGLEGQTVLYGIAFFGKEPLIISEIR